MAREPHGIAGLHWRGLDVNEVIGERELGHRIAPLPMMNCRAMAIRISGTGFVYFWKLLTVYASIPE
jgi:hypothetical protein